MALAERADLVARLSLEGNFQQRIGAATRSLRGMETSFSKIGGLAKSGLATAATNIAKIGAIAGGVVAGAVATGLQDLATLEDATTSVDGAIKQMGLTGQITSRQVAVWANEIESSVQAAFDDKAITQAATTLIRYGKVTTANLRPALVVMTDLAAKTGDVDSAASLLAKALAAPEKAAGRLARVGVVLTKEQQKQITALVKAGDAAGAQAVLLDALAKSTKGAAAASAGPYRDAINTLRDASEDARKALAQGFLPVLSKVAQRLSTAVSDPKTMQDIRDFGEGLASAFDNLLEIGGKLPWKEIGDSFKLAGSGARAVLGAFTAMPPWVQTAVLTGWGLNKLTGGALGSIIGELGKGLIKGVLGMTAGVVNIKAGIVNGAGGVGGVPGVSGGGAAPSVLATGLKLIPVIAVGALVGEALAEFNRQNGITPRNIREEEFNRQNPAQLPSTGGPSPEDRQDLSNIFHASLAISDRTEGVRIAVAANAQKVAAAAGFAGQVAAHANEVTAARTEALRQSMAARLATSNARLAAIADKRESVNITTRNNITVPVSVSVRDYNHASYTKSSVSAGYTNKQFGITRG